MLFPCIAALLAGVSPFVSAVPVKRAPTPTDVLVFKVAHVLEQLETQFYTQALAKFQESDFVAAGFTSAQIPGQLFTGIQSDESAHTSFLETALKSLSEQPISGCTFDFSPILTDVVTMASAARIVENVGVGAYLGGAALLTVPSFVATAGSILTVEARHQTILNVMNTGSAIPQAFDVPLSPPEVLAIAGQFISGCDTGIPPNPSLSITNTGTVAPGTLLTFSSPAINGSVNADSLFCQMMVGGLPMSIALPLSQCIVPADVNGPVAIWITSDGQPLLNDVLERAKSQLIAGPTMAFIDSQPQMLGMLVRPQTGSGTGSGAQSVTTATISPADAQSIIQSASAATATATAPATPPNNAGSTPSDDGVTDAVTIDGWKTVPAPQ